MTDEPTIKSVRLQKLERMRALGADPYKVERFERTHTAQEILDNFEELEGKQVRFAGRVVSFRLMGKAGFAHVSDGDAKIQGYFKKDDLGEVGWELYNLLDVGDHVGMVGELFATRTGEKSIHVRELTPLSKSLQVLPLGKEKDGEQWYGLSDPEQRHRHRHLDLICNAESRKMLLHRCKMVTAVRHFFESQGYVEVETPMLQLEAGGAAATPFKTHYNAYDMDVKLRISLELYLKRLICGDIPKVFEIGRTFRNEGVSNRHNPEFTLLEFYEAYASMEDVMTRVEELFRSVVDSVFGSREGYLGWQIARDLGLDSPIPVGDMFARFPIIFVRQPVDRAIVGTSPSRKWDYSTKMYLNVGGESEGRAQPREGLPFPGPYTLSLVDGDVAIRDGESGGYVIDARQGGATFAASSRSGEEEEFTLPQGVFYLPSRFQFRRQLDVHLPWKRVHLLDEIKRHTGLVESDFIGLELAVKKAEALDVPEKARAAGSRIDLAKEQTLGGLIEKLLEVFVEPTLIEPTFVVGYPIETSPLAKKDPKNPRLTRRFEGFVGGREICNAFSEINDPIDQRERFEQQLGERMGGADETHPYDEEFLYALEGGMPPTGGCGIGMDRLAMVLTGAEVLREVILFPTMRPE